MDKHFNVHTIARTEFTEEIKNRLRLYKESSQLLSWLAAHRDYSEELSIIDFPPDYLPTSEEEAGEKLMGMILNKGHFGVLEHAHITLECVGFPHSVAMQARTHRVPFSFDVQSQRYTGKRIIQLINEYEKLPLSSKGFVCSSDMPLFSPSLEERNLALTWKDKLETVFYSRPVGTYLDRQGKKFTIDENLRLEDLMWDFETAQAYLTRIENGYSEETARDRLAQSIRQSFFVTTNIRGFMHFLDMRYKADAQIEIQWLCDLMFKEFKLWVPQIAEWYEKKRLHKNKLAP